MIKKYFLLEIFILFFFDIFSIIKTNYVTFDLKTYRNNSNYSDEYEKFFYDNLYNMLYTEITLGPNKEKYIMEIKVTSSFFSIYNHNCEVPPADNTKNVSYNQDFANSNYLFPIGIPINGEYFTSVLENTIYLETNGGEKTTTINYLFSPRNDSEYTQKLILRPYTCFTLGFEIPFLKPNQDIDSINDYALNLVMQFKRTNITSSYNWFIEYNTENNIKAKLIIGETPYNYNSNKYNIEQSMQVKAEKRIDNLLYWDIIMNEIYLKNGTELYKDSYMNLYLTCNLEPSLGVIMGSSGYKIYIEDNFFQPLKRVRKCFSPLILDTYTVYYCNKDIKEKLKNDFSTIIFLQRTLNKTFELTYDDLFVEKENYIFFLVFFNRYDQEIWTFGKPFLKKYFFSYDLDGRTITFYQEINNEGKQYEDKSGNGNNTALIIVVAFLILVFAIIGFFVAKYIYSNRKRRNAAELKDNDDYDYENYNINNE